MLDTTAIKKLSKLCKKMTNIVRPDVTGIDENGKQLFVAPPLICSWTQNLISQVDEHAHLKDSRILVLIKVNPATDKKMAAGEVVVLGKASKPSQTGRLLSRIGDKAESIDFIITLNGGWLKAAGALDDEYKVRIDELAPIGQALALIDHELMHCSAEIAGQFIAKSNLNEFIKGLGGRHVETCEDFVNGDGDILVRYYTLNKDNNLKYKMRPHHIEEFFGVIERWGNRNRTMARLVDVIEKNQKLLFDDETIAA